ncbi:MAG TPA: hypothetical protein VNG89_28535, partial [Vicinamibacterales bacterium]|nr:hypothetical protein [Vicinamibacterales bacterium]
MEWNLPRFGVDGSGLALALEASDDDFIAAVERKVDCNPHAPPSSVVHESCTAVETAIDHEVLERLIG